MALSGSVATGAYSTSSGTRTVVFSWTATQNIINNTSTISWTLKGGGTYSGYVVVSELRVTIDGTEQYYRSSSNHTNCYNGTSLASGSLTLTHSSDGTKSFSVTVEAGIYNWAINKTGTSSFTLTTIDRAAPTVSHSTSSITASGFKISITASTTCDIFQYSTDGGSSYTTISGASGTSASITLSSLSPNTSYSVRCRARKTSNQVYGYSTAASTKTLGGSVVTSASTFTADNSTATITLKITCYSSSYYHQFNLYDTSDGSLVLGPVNIGTLTAGTSVSKTITLSSSNRNTVLNYMAAVKSFTGKFEIVTYSSSAYSTTVGDASSKTATVQTTSANSAPTFTAFTYQDTRSTIYNVTGDNQVLVKGISYLRVTCTAATANNGASIASYSATIGSSSKSGTSTTINVGTISSYGTLTLTVKCTDSRGYATTLTTSVKVLNYAIPKLSAFTLKRRNEVDALVQLSFSGTITSIKPDGSTECNSLKYVRYRYKTTDSSSYGSYTSILSSVTASGTSFSFESEELLELDEETSYDFQLNIVDQFGTTYGTYTYTALLNKGTPIISIRKRNSTYDSPRVGINNPDPKCALDVNGAINQMYIATFETGTNTVMTLTATLAASTSHFHCQIFGEQNNSPLAMVCTKSNALNYGSAGTAAASYSGTEVTVVVTLATYSYGYILSNLPVTIAYS